MEHASIESRFSSIYLDTHYWRERSEKRRANLGLNQIFNKVELLKYQQWRNRIATGTMWSWISRPSANCVFPAPIQMHEFVHQLDRRNRSKYFSTWPRSPKLDARKCFHERHIYDRYTHKSLCPVCLMCIHLEFLKKIQSVLDVREPNNKGPQNTAIRAAWTYVRSELANLTDLFEILAESEKEFDAEYTKEPSKRSFCAALKLVWGHFAGDVEEVGAQVRKSTATKVAFDQSTFEQDVESIRSRSQFQRSHSLYQPGKWAFQRHCTDGTWEQQNWMDTSRMQDVEASIRQCKLFLTEDPNDLKGSPINKGVYKGILDDWPHADKVLFWLEEAAEKKQGFDKMEHNRMMKICDSILVLWTPDKHKELSDDTNSALIKEVWVVGFNMRDVMDNVSKS